DDIIDSINLKINNLSPKEFRDPIYLDLDKSVNGYRLYNCENLLPYDLFLSYSKIWNDKTDENNLLNIIKKLNKPPVIINIIMSYLRYFEIPFKEFYKLCDNEMCTDWAKQDE